MLSVENFFTNRSFPQNGDGIYIGNTDQTEYVSMQQTYFTLEKSDLAACRRIQLSYCF